MNEKRFELLDETIFDNQKQAEDGGRVTYWIVEYQQRQELVDLLNEQQATIDKQNKLIKLIANACTYSKEHSVKEILRKEIKGIDTVTEESANAWQDYVILSEFFEEHYKEHWDNE